MTNKEYHAHPALGKSALFELTKSPQMFRYRQENPQESATLFFGQAFHKYVLEPDTFLEEFAILPECDKRTKEGKATMETFTANNIGKTLITTADFQTICDMHCSLMSNKLAASLIRNSLHEQSHFWTDLETGVKCKCRPDMEYESAKLLIDLKSCNNAGTDMFSRDCVKYGYHLQAAHYLTPFPNDWQFMFIAVEKTKPHQVNVMTADAEFIASGKMLQADLLKLYKKCSDTNNWYGYNGENGQANELSLPYWAVDNSEEENS